jgi:hypothetical protein
MSIKMGELKGEEGAFENRLKQFLTLATTWSAVVLIDEADFSSNAGRAVAVTSPMSMHWLPSFYAVSNISKVS